MRQGSLETRLVFAGHGNHPAGTDEQAEIQTFGAALYGELAARREAAPPETPSRLLLPARLVPPKETEVALQFPEKPPEPPRLETPRAKAVQSPRNRRRRTEGGRTSRTAGTPRTQRPYSCRTGSLRSGSRATASS